MRNFLNPLTLVGGPIMIFISCMGLWGILEKRDITQNGLKVIVNILDSPATCDNISKKDLVLKLEYKGRNFAKGINYKECYIIVGKENVEMLTNKAESKFIFMDEYNPSDFIYFFILFGSGVFFIFKGAHDKKKKNG